MIFFFFFLNIFRIIDTRVSLQKPLSDNSKG